MELLYFIFYIEHIYLTTYYYEGFYINKRFETAQKLKSNNLHNDGASENNSVLPEYWKKNWHKLENCFKESKPVLKWRITIDFLNTFKHKYFLKIFREKFNGQWHWYTHFIAWYKCFISTMKLNQLHALFWEK